MTIRHEPYPKIEQTLSHSTSGEWVATEKIHGANMVVATDGEEVRIGKRKAWLAVDESFFGWQMLRSDLTFAARKLHAQLEINGTTRIYGELFGGSYPHPDVHPAPHLSAVQTGVWYSPGVHFAAFDVLVEPASGEARFISYDEMATTTHVAGLMCVPLIGRGRYNELQRIPSRFETRVPAMLGLPPIAENFAEGLVIKPTAAMSPGQRDSMKKKIEEFDESRFDESRPFDPNVTWLSLADVLRIATGMMNPTRVASARSKVGEDPAQMIEEAVLDTWIDLDAMLGTRLQSLTEAEESKLRERLESAAREIIET